MVKIFRGRLTNLPSILIYLSFLIPAIFMTNCNKKSTEPEQFIYPDSNLSFIRHIHPLFIDDCTFGGCHQSANPASGLDLETLTPTFNSNNGPTVFPFDAEHSRLYRVLLENYLGIPQMPKDGTPLTIDKRKAIKTWINEGASINN